MFYKSGNNKILIDKYCQLFIPDIFLPFKKNNVHFIE
jgi:hypothetical protein